MFAGNGIEALQKLEMEEDVAIVLSDINMPKMDGLTFINKLNEAPYQVKIIMVSAYGDMTNIRKAMNRGAFDFVAKPIDFTDLDTTIQKAIQEIEALKNAEQARVQLDELQQELKVASEIQQSIQPKNFDLLTGKYPFELFAKMKAAKQVGGDFYDFFFIDEDHLVLLIGDVSGKGMSAALFMAVSRTLLRAYSHKGLSAGRCLQEVNDVLIRDNDSDLFVTVFYAILNLQNNELEYCSGGHNPPILLLPDGSIKSLEDNQFIPLGIAENYVFTSKSITIEPGTSLVLYTDGITEALNQHQEFFSEERLNTFLTSVSTLSAEAMVTNLIEEVKNFANDNLQSDDLTLLTIKRSS